MILLNRLTIPLLSIFAIIFALVAFNIYINNTSFVKYYGIKNSPCCTLLQKVAGYRCVGIRNCGGAECTNKPPASACFPPWQQKIANIPR